jgi:hypothetical protein
MGRRRVFDPEFTLFADHAPAGQLVLWNSWASGGESDLAKPQIGAASPIAIFVVHDHQRDGESVPCLLVAGLVNWTLGDIPACPTFGDATVGPIRSRPELRALCCIFAKDE